MNMKKLKWGLLAGLLATTPMIGSAAISFSVSADDSILSGLASENFTQLGGAGTGACETNGFASCGGSFEFVQGSVSNTYSAPGTDSGMPWPGIYLTVPEPGETDLPATGSVTLGSTVQQFGMLWGSVDEYNKIRFFDGNTQIGDDITGTQIANAMGVADPDNNGNFNLDAYVLFTSPSAFDTIEFEASSFAFETADHRYQVPEPMTLVLLALGLLGMGLMGRRHSRDATDANLAA